MAILAGSHEHHGASLALLTRTAPARLAVSAHSFAEAYSTLTRRSERTVAPFRFTAAEAWAALASLRTATTLVGLTAAQTFGAVGAYATAGGIGPRLYDALIGQAAVAHGIPALVTWNVGHMRGLFPALDVLTPEAFVARRTAET